MTAENVTENGKWNVDQYSKFINERTRPAAELLSRVDLDTVLQAVDLGCGPGNSTVILKRRWQEANVVGLDNSEEMLVAARRDCPGIEFVLQDLSTWRAEPQVDLAFSNAVFQWVPDHKTLLPQLCAQLAPGGVLAMQMPHNHEARTHKSMREVACENKWSVDLTGVRNEPPVLDAQTYYDVLSPLMSNIDIWETEYFHVLDSIDSVVEWLKGTGLKPFLKPLTAEEQKTWLELYKEKLVGFLKQQVDGKVLLPFPRLFVVASRRK